MKKGFIIAGLVFIAPLTASAQRFSGTAELLQSFGGLVSLALPIAGGVALLVFFWGLAKFIYNTGKGDENAIKTGRTLMIWGIIALFILVSIFGIINFIQGETGIGDNDPFGSSGGIFGDIFGVIFGS